MLSRWRESRGWWVLEPYVEITARIDAGGARRLVERAAPSLGLIGGEGQKSAQEDWTSARAASETTSGGKLPEAYYRRLTEEATAGT